MKHFIVSTSLLVTLLAVVGCATMKRAGSEQASSEPLKNSSALSQTEIQRRLSQVPKALREGDLFNTTIVEPTQVFDNVYFVGYVGVGSFVIDTSDGIILIDAMWRPADAEDVIIPGMKKLGLDPEKIKLIVITHGHADHYGSARYLEDTYGAQVMMSQIDWAYMTDPNAHNLVDPFGNYSSEIPKPSRYTPLQDGQKIVLGNTQITVLSTPGHTPGSISLLIPVKDKGIPHKAAIWGGTGLPDSLNESKAYLKSLNYFESKANEENVDAEMSTHPFSNNLLNKMELLRARNIGVPSTSAIDNPIVIGNEAFRTYIDANLRKPVTNKISSFKKIIESEGTTKTSPI